MFCFFSLTFVFNPSSKVYGFESMELKPGGENMDVTLDNIEEYVELVTDVCLRTGIQRQMEAFRSKCTQDFAYILIA
jgi:hypothetical protein